jgi:glycogen(starch) synthase
MAVRTQSDGPVQQMISSLIVSGDKCFLDRYQGLTSALSHQFPSVKSLPSGNLMELMPVRVINRLAWSGAPRRLLQSYLQSLDRHVNGFAVRSWQTEQKIARLSPSPNFVLHVFSSFAPFWTFEGIPYAMYLDYTMVLARQEWPAWARFRNAHQYLKWREAERRSYGKASILFTMGANAKRSLVADYGIADDKIHVVGSAGNFDYPYEGKKRFGTKRILFQGSEFERKGGDIVLSAFRLVREKISDVELVIIGTTVTVNEPGISVVGYVNSRKELEEFFCQSDVVVAPARCDPFTAFVIEAMNYGVPCVVSKISGISEVITNGRNGMLVDRPDSICVANAILDLLTNPPLLEFISEQSRDLVRSQLNWTVVAGKVAGALRSTNIK